MPNNHWLPRYFAFVKRCGDNLRQAQLIARIKEIYHRSRYRYGSWRIMHQLRHDGYTIPDFPT